MIFLGILLVILAATVLAVIALRMLFPLPEVRFATETSKLPVSWDTVLGAAVRRALDRHPGANGIRSLDDGRAAFAARAILARTAARSIDAQYYIWHDDTTGLMLLDELRAAAERGVRVRLLVDDNGIAGLDGKLAALDAMPTAEVRIFNPFTLRSPKLASYLFDFRRLNRRMHNKSMTFDGVVTVVGGRNIGDIYFAYGTGTHYFDVDVIVIGPVVDEVSDTFDDYWNSGSVYGADRILPRANGGLQELMVAAATARASADGAGYQRAVESNDLAQHIRARDLDFEWASVRLFVDDPAKGLGKHADGNLIVGRLVAVAEECRTSLDLVSAYFIPRDWGTEFLVELSRRGVATRILTNSLDATDVPPVHAAYTRYRKRLLEGSVQLLELRSMRRTRPDRTLPDILAGSASGLHAKVFAFDRKRLFVGSYNLDPRSAQLNTEMGFLIDSPTMAAAFAETLDAPFFAYRLQLDSADNVVWKETESNGQVLTYRSEPNAGLARRVVIGVMRRLPMEWML